MSCKAGKNLNFVRRRFLSKVFFLAVLLASGCWQAEKTPEITPAREIVGDISIIPQPYQIERTGGEFELNAETKIAATDETGLKMAVILNQILTENYGLTLETTDQTNLPNSIAFITSRNAQKSDTEVYNLKIAPEYIQINGTERGMFYAIQSLRQILPPEFSGNVKIPAARIMDAPRFSYRGMHLDVARHFMPAEFVKKYIALLSRYKYNFFHWHLTDDQGWRIEIKKYPRLTSVGSRRPETVRGKNYRPYIGDGTPVEGFYTQEEIRDIVEFAKSHYVTIIPEIDLPGHSSAALASYPEYGCRTDYPYRVKTMWGGFPDVYCPTEQTLGFLTDVLGEVIDLFPNSPYVHIGGDEVMFDHWQQSDFVRELKKRENLKTEKDVQSWFIRQIEKFVNSKGKTMIGWDDILGEGIAPSATIMSWRGFSYAVQAARSKHNVIMTPSDFTYFDHPQTNESSEPLSLGKQVTLKDVYEFEPVPPELSPEEARYIIGGQGCVWTEFIKKPGDVEYMAFPRALALAEVLWTKRKEKNFAEFSKRLYHELPQLERANVNYKIPKPPGLNDRILASNDEVIIDLNPPIRNGKIYYTLDGKNPNADSDVYDSPFVINVKPNETVELKAKIITFNGRESSVFTAKYKRQTKPPGRAAELTKEKVAR